MITLILCFTTTALLSFAAGFVSGVKNAESKKVGIAKSLVDELRK